VKPARQSSPLAIPTAAVSCLLQQADVCDALKSLLFSRVGLWSDVPAFRHASLRAVSLLFAGVDSVLPAKNRPPNGAAAGGRSFVLSTVFPKMLQTLSSFPALSSHLTDVEVEIWRAAEGVLYTPPNDGSKDDFVGQVNVSKNVRKDRVGKRGGGVDEDEEYLENLSKQLAAQKLGSLRSGCLRCCVL
jgi:hypothetical protein